MEIQEIRNKLTPFKNLIAMLEHYLTLDDNIGKLIKEEIEQCKENIKYLSQNN